MEMVERVLEEWGIVWRRYNELRTEHTEEMASSFIWLDPRILIRETQSKAGQRERGLAMESLSCQLRILRVCWVG